MLEWHNPQKFLPSTYLSPSRYPGISSNNMKLIIIFSLKKSQIKINLAEQLEAEKKWPKFAQKIVTCQSVKFFTRKPHCNCASNNI